MWTGIHACPDKEVLGDGSRLGDGPWGLRMDGSLDLRARPDGLVHHPFAPCGSIRRHGARDILRTRFARGEIDQAEYEQACRVLDPEKEPRK